MRKKMLCALLSILLLNVASLAQTNEEKLKIKIVQWGLHKTVTVKLNSGEKLEGRIAEIKDDLFAVQFVDKDKVTARELRYSDVNKISGKDGGKAGKIVGYTALGVLAGVGVTFLIVLGIWANN